MNGATLSAEEEEVHLSTAPSGVYEVVYNERDSQFMAVAADVSITTTPTIANGGASHKILYRGGLLAAAGAPGAVPHGAGELTFEDSGESYSGEFRCGKRHGRGTWVGPPSAAALAAAALGGGGGGGVDTSASAAAGGDTSAAAAAQLPTRCRYEGEWRNDQRHGKGTETFTDGRHFVGEFANNRCCGVGTLSFNNGDVFRGTFDANGLPHDQKGEYSFANGDVLMGAWIEGKRQGNFTVAYASSTHSYQATFSNDVMVNVVFVA